MISIVIPVYNERESLPLLHGEIQRKILVTSGGITYLVDRLVEMVAAVEACTSLLAIPEDATGLHRWRQSAEKARGARTEWAGGW